MFWRNFEFLCETVGKSTSAVAFECGVKSSGSVSAWKTKGALPRQSTLDAIAKYFDVSPLALTRMDMTKSYELSKKFSLTTFSSNERVSEELSVTFDDLSADEIALVNAYVAGLRASRKP